MPVSRNTRAALVALAVLVILTGFGLIVRARHDTNPAPEPTTAASTPGVSPTPPAASTPWSPSPPAPATDVHLAWAYVDSIDGNVRTGGDKDLHELDNLIAPALAQDYLNHNDPAADTNERLSAALAGSADDITWLDQQNGGRNEEATRTIDRCSLTDTKLAPVRMTALETARLGACLREGGLAQPASVSWVLDEMRKSTGGIGQARGSDSTQQVAQQNSVVLAGDRYRAGCLVVGAFWSAAVLADYPADHGESYALTLCADTARTAFPPDMQQVPETPSPTPAATAVGA